MNRAQKLLTITLLLGLTVTLVFFPWVQEVKSTGWRYTAINPIIMSPHALFRPDYAKALMIWAWMGAVYAGLFFVFNRSGK